MTRMFLIVILLICVIFFLCRLIAFSEQKKKVERENTEKTLKRIYKCDNCEIGKRSFEIDKHSENCPYLASWKDEECHFFKEIESGCSE